MSNKMEDNDSEYIDDDGYTPNSGDPNALFQPWLGSSSDSIPTPIRVGLSHSNGGIFGFPQNNDFNYPYPPTPSFGFTPGSNNNFPPQTPSSHGNNNMSISTPNTPSAYSHSSVSTPSLPPQPTPQPPQAHQTAQQILATIYSLLNEQEEKLKKIAGEQAILLQNPQLDVYNSILSQQRLLREQMDTEFRALQQLNQQVILDPPDLARMGILQQELKIQMKQLELYQSELQQLIQPQPTIQPIAALVLTKQPFPMVISKNKQLSEEQLTVKLLTGSASNVVPATAAKATLLCDNASARGAPANPMEFDVNNMNPQRVAHFPLKFVSGTRRCAVHVKMGITVRAGPASIAVESDMSNPFVVITNECQWEGSAGTLLKKDAFGGQLEIPWPQFVNTLQRHFLIATRQDVVRPKRPLSLWDFQYINTQFFGNRNIIHQREFDTFWNWFGKSMQTLRYQRHICALWQTGVIYGLMNRDDVNAPLQNQEPGTFLIRFSENNPGQFGIAYCSAEYPVRVKHYLVQPNDCFAARKTFPDFLAECPKFVYLLQLQVDPSGRQSFTKVHKDMALEPYTARRPTAPPLGGYEPLG